MSCGFLVLSARVSKAAAAVEAEAVAAIRERIGPVAAFKSAIIVERLPKTRLGKILRGTMKKIAEREAYTTPATIEGPAALETIETAWAARGSDLILDESIGPQSNRGDATSATACRVD